MTGHSTDYPLIGLSAACIVVLLALLSYGLWCAKKARNSPFGWTWWFKRARQPALLSKDDLSALTNNLVRTMFRASTSVCADTLQSPSDEVALLSARVASRYTTKDPVDSAEVQRIISTVMSQNNISLVFEAVRTGDIEFVLLSRKLRPEWLHAMHEWIYTGGSDNESRRCTLLHEGARRVMLASASC